jgi:hypothetical protein
VGGFPRFEGMLIASAPGKGGKEFAQSQSFRQIHSQGTPGVFSYPASARFVLHAPGVLLS